MTTPIVRTITRTRMKSFGRLLCTSASSSRSVDVTIVGGGVIGSSIAFHLASRAEGLKVRVIEKDPSYAHASSTLSAASIRQQFSNLENVEMSLHGISFLRNAGELLRCPGDAPDGSDDVNVQLREGGYLFLSTSRGRGVLERNHAVQTGAGADVVLLDETDLSIKFPWLRTNPPQRERDELECGVDMHEEYGGGKHVVAGAHGNSGEGWFDPAALLHGLKRKAIALGVEYVHGVVHSIGVCQDNAVHSVAYDVVHGDGTRSPHSHATGWLVNAAGASAQHIHRLVDAHTHFPVVPRKRCVFVWHSRDAEDSITNCPLVIDPSGVYFRPEGRGVFIGGVSPIHDPDVHHKDFEVDHRLFDEVVWPIVAARVPAFEGIKMTGAWAGHYAMNTHDANVIIGPHTSVDNFIYANGFSGHGLQQSPAIGRAVSELIIDGEYRTLDLSRLGFDRVLEGRRVVEENVV